MKKSINICEVCGKKTDDYYSEIGWIHIDNIGLAVTKGRDEKGNAKTKFTSDIKSEHEIDFCGIDCFIKFLAGEIK